MLPVARGIEVIFAEKLFAQVRPAQADNASGAGSTGSVHAEHHNSERLTPLIRQIALRVTEFTGYFLSKVFDGKSFTFYNS